MQLWESRHSFGIGLLAFDSSASRNPADRDTRAYLSEPS